MATAVTKVLLIALVLWAVALILLYMHMNRVKDENEKQLDALSKLEREMDELKQQRQQFLRKTEELEDQLHQSHATFAAFKKSLEEPITEPNWPNFFDNDDNSEHSKRYSSFKCTDEPAATRSCAFTNICYNRGRYLFFSASKEQTQLVKSMNPFAFMSTGEEFNVAPIQMTPEEREFIGLKKSNGNEQSYKIKLVTKDKEAFMVHRLSANNPHHNMNNDLMPLYWLLTRFGTKNLSKKWNSKFQFYQPLRSNVKVVMNDQQYDNMFLQWYKTLSTDPIISLANDESNSRDDHYYCFERLVVGVGGKCIHCPKPMTYQEVQNFNKHLQFYYYSQNPENLQRPFSTPYFHEISVPHNTSIVQTDPRFKFTPTKNILIINRKSRRLLLNADEILSSVIKKYPNHFITEAVLENLSFPQIQELFSQADIVVGIHGAALGNMVFMRPYKCVVELFPYQLYLPFFQTYSQHLHIHHVVWSNNDRNNTVFHDDAISNDFRSNRLSPAQKQKLRTIPNWSAHWHNQDTKVPPETIHMLIDKCMGMVDHQTTPATVVLELGSVKPTSRPWEWPSGTLIPPFV